MMYHIQGIFLGLVIIVVAIVAYRDRNHFSKKLEEARRRAETEKAGGRK